MKIKATDIVDGPGKYYSDKVPYGYNFADKNDEIIDTTGSEHGMHVAGIVAADATDEDYNNGIPTLFKNFIVCSSIYFSII